MIKQWQTVTFSELLRLAPPPVIVESEKLYDWHISLPRPDAKLLPGYIGYQRGKQLKRHFAA